MGLVSTSGYAINDNMNFKDIALVTPSFVIGSKTFKFTADDWNRINNEYVVSITREEHGFTEKVLPKLYIYDTETKKHVSVGYISEAISITIDKDGNILIEADEPYELLIEVVDISD